ncbi:hypothetical protein AMS68_001412 [Peltaster fructicola]|uniref:U three protein 23 n=1 Tax=Peltaster fructicola TaxID=286661 RepID=A0A6H0XMN6_9PEZI|nr:hypothetical protein AMS68_001412 [Peltaster fructicola]
MGGKRTKQYRKAMHAYALSFNFREPYQILLDAEMIRDAARFKMKLGSMLEKTLHGTIKPMITQCCIRHLYDAEVEPEQKADKENWIEVAKQAERTRCGHHELETPLSALECIKSVVDPKDKGTNKHRYAVASQDLEIRQAMRQIAGVPLIYINRSVMILEPLAAKTEQIREAAEVGKRKAGLRTRPALVVGEKRKRDDEEEVPQETAKRKKPRGPKGPNPLSVKKAKKITNSTWDGERSRAAEMASKAAPKTQEQLADAADRTDLEAPHKKRKRRRKAAAAATQGNPAEAQLQHAVADTSD